MSVKTFVAQRLLPLLARLDLLEAGSSAANAALFLATSTTSNAIGTGQKTFTTQSGKAFVAGQFVQVSDQANPANYMLGQVSSYSGTSLVVEVSSVGGSGTKTAWNIALSGPGGATGGISGGTLTGDLGDAPEVTVASAATTNIGAANSNKVVVSGNVTITAFDSVANRRKLLRFTGAPLLTHGANLILPGAADMQMAAGDLAEFTSDGSGVWRMRKYQSVSESNYGRSLLSTAGAVAARAILAALGLAGEEASEVDVASAATTDIGAAASNKVRITGTTTITSLGTGANLRKRVRFASALTLTHNATSLILPGGANIITAGGDVAVLESNASGNWRLVSYQRAATQFQGGFGPRTSATVTSGVLDLGAYPSHYVSLSGAGQTVTDFGTGAALSDPIYMIEALSNGHTITPGANLRTPGSASIIMRQNDVVLVMYYAAGGVWKVINQFRAETQFQGGFGPAITVGANSTVDLGASGYYSHFVQLGGTAQSITALGSSASTSDPFYRVRFTSAHTLVYNATSLILPGGVNITAGGGDVADFEYLGSGNWRLVNYQSATGKALVSDVPRTVATVVDDAAITIPLGSTAAIVAVTTTTSGASSISGLYYVRAASGPVVTPLGQQDGTNVNFTTGPLNGTTGVDGKSTLSADTAGNLYLENRTGGSRALSVTILAYR